MVVNIHNVLHKHTTSSGQQCNHRHRCDSGQPVVDQGFNLANDYMSVSSLDFITVRPNLWTHLSADC